MNDSQLLLRPAEAARALGIARSRVYALTASGAIPTVRIGRSVRVPAESLRQWIAARTVAPDGRER